MCNLFTFLILGADITLEDVRPLLEKVSNEIKDIRDKILDEIAFIETALDDPEHISVDGYGEKLRVTVDKLLEELDELLKTSDNGRIIKEGIKTVIVGKPNAGKSSLINRILGEERLIVSDVAGTTRDAIDTKIKIDDKEYTFIDTAGVRKKSKINDNIEKYTNNSICENLTKKSKTFVVIN